ncbi:MAG: phosphomannomutase/phosphoglucomutase [Chromatiales bacterium]
MGTHQVTFNTRPRSPWFKAGLLFATVLAAVPTSPPVPAAADAKAAAQSVAQAAAAALAPYTAQLRSLAGDAKLIALLRGGDPAALDSKAAELAGQFPEALRVRLIPRGTAKADPGTTPPLTFASLAMITKAENSSGPVPAEMQLFGSPAQHIALVQRIGDGEEVAGVAHLSLKFEVLSEALAPMTTDAYVELRQPTGGPKPWVMGGVGGRGPPEGVVPAMLAVEGTAWQVAYWDTTAAAAQKPGDNTSPSPGHSVLTWALVLAFALVVAGVWWFSRQRRQGGLAAGDTAQFQGAVSAIMQGGYPEVEHLIPGLPQRSGTAPPRSKADEAMLARVASRAAAAVAGQAAAKPTIEVSEAQDEEERAPPTTVVKPTPKPTLKGPPESIFRAYDIRGVVGEGLTPEGLHQIGLALGSEAAAQGQAALVVARDGRRSSPMLSEALVKGLLASGRDVIDIGLAPTPVLYFATHFLDTLSGVMVTGSHNPPQYNGLKIVLNGQALSGDAIKAIHRRIQADDYSSGQGTLGTTEIIPEYIQRISEDIPLALDNPLRIVVDCGNGVPGVVAPRLLRALGHDIIELYCEVDGNFPNHHPDPSQPENLAALIQRVRAEKADLGLAFDGDGDRLGVVDSDGHIIWPDRQMMLFARDVLSRNRGAEIIFDVKCSRYLKKVIEQAGGKPVMWKTGHSLIKSKMRETGAPLAGEMSGHIFFKERWYGFDDALYAAARLVEILVNDGRPPKTVFAELPGGVSTPELRLDMPENRHAEFMNRLIASARFEGAQLSTIDGLRVDLPKAWGLIRPSNTTPVLVLRFEADDAAALAAIQEKFRSLLRQLDPSLRIPF